MSLYVFLRPGRIATLSEREWPEPGTWMHAGVDAPREAVGAYRLEDLLWCLDDELWEVEVDGETIDEGRMLIAERARLARQVEAWGPAAAQELVETCAHRVRDAAAEALTEAGRELEARTLAVCDSFDELERTATQIAAAGDDDAARLAGFAADVVLYARDARDPVRAAGVAAYIAAHALAGGDKTVAGYETRFQREQRGQVEWLQRRLQL
jgi:hypothetical protein